MKPSLDIKESKQDLTLPHHPGRVLGIEFKTWLKIPYYDAAERMGVSAELLRDIIRGKRNLTENVALRYQAAFRQVISPWLRRTLEVYGFDPFDEIAVYLCEMQSRRNLEVLRRRDLSDFVQAPFPARNIVPHHAIRADSPSSRT